MSLSNTLSANFPLGTSETNPDHTTSNLTISEEGFKDFVKNRLKDMVGHSHYPDSSSTKREPSKATVVKDSPVFKEMESRFKWIENNIIKGDPSKLNFKDGNVELGPKYSSFFYRNGKQVDDILKEATSDLAVYQGLINRYKTRINQNNRQKKIIEKEAGRFLANDTHPEGLEEFTSLMKKWETFISPINVDFREPNASLLAYDKQSFLINGLFHDGSETKVIKVNELLLPALTSDKAKKLADLIKKIIAFTKMLDLISEEGLGIDATDPPFRSYISEVVENNPEFLMLYTHPNLEAVSTDLVNHVLKRCDELQDALVSYFRNSLA